jgi:hypothetical protein
MKYKNYINYDVTEEGKVFSLKFNKKIQLKESNLKGYSQIGLCQNNKVKSFHVHRLVAECFIPNPLNLPQVNHKDGNKKNNYVWNLEWCTSKENCNHAVKNGLRDNKGIKNISHKLIDEQVREIRRKYVPRKYTQQQLADEYNVYIGLIQHIVNYQLWKHI